MKEKIVPWYISWRILITLLLFWSIWAMAKTFYGASFPLNALNLANLPKMFYWIGCGILMMMMLAVLGRLFFVCRYWHFQHTWVDVFFMLTAFFFVLGQLLNLAVGETDIIDLKDNDRIASTVFDGYEVILDGQQLLIKTNENIRWHGPSEVGSYWKVNHHTIHVFSGDGDHKIRVILNTDPGKPFVVAGVILLTISMVTAMFGTLRQTGKILNERRRVVRLKMNGY